MYVGAYVPPGIDSLPTPVGVMVRIPQNETIRNDVIVATLYAPDVESPIVASVAQIDAEVHIV